MAVVKHRVEWQNSVTGQWVPYEGALNGKAWCLGFLAAVDSRYPSPPSRVVKLLQGLDGPVEVVRETAGRERPTINDY